eukprot:6190048-Prymnesium_polylepis.1
MAFFINLIVFDADLEGARRVSCGVDALATAQTNAKRAIADNMVIILEEGVAVPAYATRVADGSLDTEH